MSKSNSSRLAVVVAVLLAAFSVGCGVFKAKPIANSGAVCEIPTPAEAASFEAYVLSTLPSQDGWPLELSPGSQLPPGAEPATNPEFYAGASWAQGLVCRACPELCAEGEE